MKIATRYKNTLLAATLVATLAAVAPTGAAPAKGVTGEAAAASLSAAPVVYWSNEARRAIVPAGPGGVFGTDNYGNKFPGDAAVYMGIVQAAVYDTALAFGGGYRPYAIDLTAPAGASSEAAIATAAHHTLIGLQPELGLTPAQQAILDGHYADYMAAIPDGTAKIDGIVVGEQAAAAVVALRQNDGRGATPVYGQPPFVPPPAGPGVWTPSPGPVLGMVVAGIRPLALESASQFRPDPPVALASQDYAADFRQVKAVGSLNSTARTPEQTGIALFWTDHNVRQWNEGLLDLAAARDLDMLETARLLAMAHVSGGDALIGCFEAKFHYTFWRPVQAIRGAGTDGNPDTQPDPNWTPLRGTPNYPEYPSGHSCHTAAMAEAVQAYFGTNKVEFSLNSRITNSTREFGHLQEAVMEVMRARVWIGFHFRNADQVGANLGRHVSQYVANNYFQPVE